MADDSVMHSSEMTEDAALQAGRMAGHPWRGSIKNIPWLEACSVRQIRAWILHQGSYASVESHAFG
jgi:hypothetical protein